MQTYFAAKPLERENATLEDDIIKYWQKQNSINMTKKIKHKEQTYKPLSDFTKAKAGDLIVKGNLIFELRGKITSDKEIGLRKVSITEVSSDSMIKDKKRIGKVFNVPYSFLSELPIYRKQ